MTIGAALHQARVRAGLTVAALSAATRVQPRIVAALEADDFTACRGDVYARGHLRTVAGHLGLDPGPLLRAYQEQQPGPPSSPADVLIPLLLAAPPPVAQRLRQHRLTRRVHQAGGRHGGRTPAPSLPH